MNDDEFLYKRLLKDFLLRFEGFFNDKDEEFKKISFNVHVKGEIKSNETILLWNALLRMAAQFQFNGARGILESIVEGNYSFDDDEVGILQPSFKSFVKDNENDWNEILYAINNRTKESSKQKPCKIKDAIAEATKNTEYVDLDWRNILRTFHRIIGGIVWEYSGYDYKKIHTNSKNKKQKYFLFDGGDVPTLQELWGTITPRSKIVVDKIINKLEAHDKLKKKSLRMVSNFLKLNFDCGDVKGIDDKFQKHLDDMLKEMEEEIRNAEKRKNNFLDTIERLFGKLQRCFVFLKKRHV